MADWANKKDLLEKVFLSFDKTGDQLLEAREIRDMLCKLFPGISDRDIAEYVTNVGGEDQKVSFAEFWVEFLKINMADVSNETLEAKFRALDTDGSGTLDIDECKILLSNLKDSEAKAEELAKFDKNGDGKISLDEFLAIWNRKL